MAAKPTSFDFEGRTISFPELARQFSGYGRSALRAYLNAGARTRHDLVAMDADARRRRLAAARKNGQRRAFEGGRGLPPSH